MEYKVLNNGIKMPMVGFGTFLNNGDECEKSVCQAIQAGYRLIDIAEAYGNEKEVGKGIQLSGIDRKELFIVTKVNFKSYENTRETGLNSLKNLQVDYLDMVLLHWPFGNYYQAWKELEKLYEEGIIKAIGVSNFESDQLVDLIAFNKVKPVINQIETHLYCQRHKHHEWEDKYDVAHMAYAPLGQGKANEMFQEEKVVELSQKYHKTTRQIAMKYLVQKGISVITRPMQKQWMKDNLNLFDFTLNEDEMNYLASFDLLEYNTKPSQDYQRTLSMLEK